MASERPARRRGDTEAPVAVSTVKQDQEHLAERVVSRAAHYGRVPVTLLFAPDVKSEEIHLYAHLTTFDFNMTGEAWPGRELAAQELSWSVRSLDRWLAALEKRGAIHRQQRGTQAALIELCADVYRESPDVAGLPDTSGLPHRVARLATSRKRPSYRTTKNEADSSNEPKLVLPPTQGETRKCCPVGISSVHAPDCPERAVG